MRLGMVLVATKLITLDVGDRFRCRQMSQSHITYTKIFPTLFFFFSRHLYRFFIKDFFALFFKIWTRDISWQWRHFDILMTSSYSKFIWILSCISNLNCILVNSSFQPAHTMMQLFCYYCFNRQVPLTKTYYHLVNHFKS